MLHIKCASDTVLKMLLDILTGMFKFDLGVSVFSSTDWTLDQ